MASKVPAAAASEMRKLCAELAEELSRFQANCRQCGSCCHFGSSGLFLYLSTVEAAMFFEEPHEPTKDLSGEVCPYLKGKECANRENRSIGCRTYFCDPKFREDLEKLYEKYLGRAKESCRRFGLSWEYCPLNVWMERETSSKGEKA